MYLDDIYTYDRFDETLKLSQVKGHKVKGQGHMCIYVKILFRR